MILFYRKRKICQIDRRTAALCLHPPLDSDAPGAATRGVIVRILVLPGHVEEAAENLVWLAGEVFTDLHVAVMSQYTPVYKAHETPPFDRTVTEEEYDLVAEAAEDFGFTRGWVQGFESSGESNLLGEQMSPGHGEVKA